MVPHIPGQLPGELWQVLERADQGEAIDWRPLDHAEHVLGVTRIPLRNGYLLLVSEVSDKHVELSRCLHRQRLEAIGRLVASIAHELRNSVASIVYSADLLRVDTELDPATLRDTADDLLTASRRLQATVDGLLDYARVGPTVSVPVSLREVLTRAQGFLGSVYGKGSRRLEVNIRPDAEWVRGNTLSIEQVFVNLLLNAAEAGGDCVTVWIDTESAPPPSGGAPMVRARVRDDGPGVPERARNHVFRPFFSGRERGTGLGLPNALEATRSLGGDLVLEESQSGAVFTVYLPHASEKQ